jgi:hypothetical protein
MIENLTPFCTGRQKAGACEKIVMRKENIGTVINGKQ